MNIRNSIILILCSIFALSCNESNQYVDTFITGSNRGITSDRDTSWLPFLKRNFPHEMGTQWEYLATDSASGYRDTSTLNMARVSEANDTSIVYELDYGGSASVYDAFYSDGLVRLGLLFTHPTLQFPLYVGRGWGYVDSIHPDWYADTSTVISRSALQVKAGYFSDSYHVVRMRRLYAPWFQEDVWFVPYVGVAKLILRTFPSASAGVLTLELIKYTKPYSRTH